MKMVQKTTAFERVNHFVLLVSFFVLMLTGLGFTYTALNWLNTAFGGNAWADVFHKWFGVVFAVSAAFTLTSYISEALSFDEDDKKWLSVLGGYFDKAVEGFTNQYGETVFSNLNTQRYYVDVWEEQHHNYWLAEESVEWIETHELVPNEVNRFWAYVDFVEEPLKSSGERDRSIMNIRKLEKVDRRMYEDKLESIKLKMEERKVRDEAIQKV
ncbi:hypothetical protein LCGC14_2237320, partial [marine sediment metagenome]